jgi:anti-sigma-K factor RskA
LKGYEIITMERTETRDDHGRFEKLCALAQTDSLSVEERLDLECHLQICGSCRQIYQEYAEIGESGMAFLAGSDALTEEAQSWDNRTARKRLFSSIRSHRPHIVFPIDSDSRRVGGKFILRFATRGSTIASLAACIMVAVALGAYHLGERKSVASRQVSPALPLVQHAVAPVRQAYADLLAAQASKISKLEQQIASGKQELERRRAASSIAEERVRELGVLNGEREADLRQSTEERDKLANRLSQAEKAYESLQADFNSLKGDHNRSLLHTASLEAEIDRLKSVSTDQQRRLKDAEQYLTSDRDIRELMGARKLYIADVFDVDSASHTRKPFGRVFYTQDKSLVFYAFDLDHQPGVKNAGVFQVWGQRDAESNGASHPMNLGILYMDSETNRRWVLRSDDPKQLAEIDAVFVTVEPHGGSQKPTGKPLLYALLRKEANHP